MPEDPLSSPVAASLRLHRCIRDLAALNALPSMCIGRTPDETLDLIIDMLPTALSCDLVYLEFPGAPSRERGVLKGAKLSEPLLAELRLVNAFDAEEEREITAERTKLYCLEVELPLGTQRGRLVVGRPTPFDPATDRVLVRSASNLIGTTLQSAHVLDSARRKDEFLAMLGHELRNPLAPILTAVELLARYPVVAREQEVIERHTRYLARLVDDLLDISRVTRGHIELRNEQVSLASVLEGAVETASPLFARHAHQFTIASAEGITLRGDPVRLAQVFGNLLTNAAKFTPRGGAIEVTVATQPGKVRVSVRDNGRGIDPEQQRRIFEPFVQVDRERDALGGGLGLGLAIVSNLVERHAGAISVHSDGPNRGSTFTVELPIVAAVRQEPQPVPAESASTRSGVRVLVVDDNVDVADLLCEALSLEGFETAVEHDAPSALEAWRRFVPHAAVLDVGLPGFDGYELAKRVRAEYGANPTLIAATGYGQLQDRRRALEAGFDCHLVKPVSIHELIRVIDRRVVAPTSGRSA